MNVLGNLFSVQDQEKIIPNLDWTSIVIQYTKSKLGKYGYSRDYRPDKLLITSEVNELDKLLITLEVNELKRPIKISIGVTVNSGKVLDSQHFSTLIIR